MMSLNPICNFQFSPRPPNPTAIRVSSCHGLSRTSLRSAWTCSTERESKERGGAREIRLSQRERLRRKVGKVGRKMAFVTCDCGNQSTLSPTLCFTLISIINHLFYIHLFYINHHKFNVQIAKCVEVIIRTTEAINEDGVMNVMKSFSFFCQKSQSSIFKAMSSIWC